MSPAAGVHFRRSLLTDLIYADDICLKASSLVDLQVLIDALVVHCATLRMRGQWRRQSDVVSKSSAGLPAPVAPVLSCTLCSVTVPRDAEFPVGVG